MFRNNWFAMLLQMDVEPSKVSRRISLAQAAFLRILGPILRVISSFFSACRCMLLLLLQTSVSP